SSDWMHWLLNAHVRRYHQHYRDDGHLWQGRFKAFPIEEDEHLLTVLRYVERNPLRAGMVTRAEAWPWSSMVWWTGGLRPTYAEVGPVLRPDNWVEYVNAALTVAELTRVRESVNRGTPYGSEGWARETAARLGLEASLRPRGRPRKSPS